MEDKVPPVGLLAAGVDESGGVAIFVEGRHWGYPQ